jgi:hypothetical protein
MVVGFNHNIRYKGELFHVQTEDSGRANPHIITLLYRGGTILGSAKTSYADILTAEQLELVVESIMKEQHKEMMRRLKNGEFDARIFGTPASSPAPQESAAPAPVQTAPSQALSAVPQPVPAAAPVVDRTDAVPAATPTAARAAASTQAAPAATPAASPQATAPAASPSPATGDAVAAVREAAAAALATALSKQQPAPKVTQAPASGAAPASTTKRSLDEVILDYLITGEE